MIDRSEAVPPVVGVGSRGNICERNHVPLASPLYSWKRRPRGDVTIPLVTQQFVRGQGGILKVVSPVSWL